VESVADYCSVQLYCCHLKQYTQNEDELLPKRATVGMGLPADFRDQLASAKVGTPWR
jgi:hypothetical protein